MEKVASKVLAEVKNTKSFVVSRRVSIGKEERVVKERQDKIIDGVTVDVLVTKRVGNQRIVQGAETDTCRVVSCVTPLSLGTSKIGSKVKNNKRHTLGLERVIFKVVNQRITIFIGKNSVIVILSVTIF